MNKINSINEANSRENTLKELIHELLNIDIMKKTRQRDVVDARKIYSTILHTQGQGVTHISKTLRKNHATIIHYIKDSAILLLMDKKYKHNYTCVLDAFTRKMEGGEIVLMTRLELEHEIARLREENYNIKIRYLNHLRNVTRR